MISKLIDSVSIERKKIGLASSPSKIDVSTAFESLTNTYLTHINSHYRISHDSVRENLAFMFIKHNTSQAIKELGFIYLTDHTKCFDQGKALEETVYVLEPKEVKLLAKRMIKEIRNGNVVVVCAHKAWKSTSFIDEFMNCALSYGDSETPVLTEDPRNIFTTKDNSSVCIFYYDIFEALKFFNHTEAVKKILNNSFLRQLLQGKIICIVLSFEFHLQYTCGMEEGFDANDIDTASKFEVSKVKGT